MQREFVSIGDERGGRIEFLRREDWTNDIYVYLEGEDIEWNEAKMQYEVRLSLAFISAVHQYRQVLRQIEELEGKPTGNDEGQIPTHAKVDALAKLAAIKSRLTGESDAVPYDQEKDPDPPEWQTKE